MPAIAEPYTITPEMEKEAYSVLPDPSNPPFGVTLQDCIDFDRKQIARQEAFRQWNAPLRDVEKQSYWDFMSEHVEGEDEFLVRIFTPELFEMFS